MEGARSTALLGALLVLAGGLFDAEGLYVAGFAFLVLAGLSVLWVISGARGLTVERTLTARRVVEDEPLLVELTLSTSHLSLPACSIDDGLLGEPMRIGSSRRKSATIRVSARFGRRGRRVLAPTAAIVRDPLGLSSRAVTGTRSHELLVLPRIEPLVVPGEGEGDGGSVARRLRPGVVQSAEVDVDGIRPYREGAPASRIHWPSVARTGEMIERRLLPEGDARPLVLLDARAGTGPGALENLDAAVRAAASLCVHLAKSGGVLLLLPGDRRPSPLEPSLAAWPHIHARLAIVEEGDCAPLAGLASRRGPLLYVASRVPARPPAVLGHAPSAARFLIVPGARGSRRAAFTVSGCSAYDMAPAVRRRKAAV